MMQGDAARPLKFVQKIPLDRYAAPLLSICHNGGLGMREMSVKMLKWLFASLGIFALPSIAHALPCTVDADTQCFQFTQAGTSGATVPFGSIQVDTAGNVLTITVDVSPNYDITT